jgi:DNA-binding transcriptional LysR family regulator
MDRVQQLATFARVAELESFTQAAAQLGLPKATVSLAVRELEGAVGVRLLQRTTRRVSLTEDGRVFHARSRELVSDVEELFSMFQRTDAELSGRLRVDMPTGVARNIVAPRLPDFLKAHPKIELELSSTDRRVDLIREGFDCVLRVGALSDSTLIAKALGSFKLINCASPAYLRTHGTPRRLADLQSHRLIHYAPVLGQRPDGFEVYDGSTTRSVEMAGSLSVNSAVTYEAACLAGLGIIQAPSVGLQHLLRAKQLVRILPKFEAAPMPAHLLYAARSQLSRRVATFMRWLTVVMEQALRETRDQVRP